MLDGTFSRLFLIYLTSGKEPGKEREKGRRKLEGSGEPSSYSSQLLTGVRGNISRSWLPPVMRGVMRRCAELNSCQSWLVVKWKHVPPAQSFVHFFNVKMSSRSDKSAAAAASMLIFFAAATLVVTSWMSSFLFGGVCPNLKELYAVFSFLDFGKTHFAV